MASPVCKFLHLNRAKMPVFISAHPSWGMKISAREAQFSPERCNSLHMGVRGNKCGNCGSKLLVYIVFELDLGPPPFRDGP